MAVLAMIMCAVALFLLLLFICQRGENRKLENDLVIQDHEMMVLRHKANLWDKHLQSVIVSPVQCPVCGKFMRGGKECAILVEPVHGNPRVVHVHKIHLSHILKKSERDSNEVFPFL